MTLPKVSIISPCYNGSKYLEYFFESLLSQNYSNVEYIFVNDGSTDDTEKIFYKYKNRLEEKKWRVIYLRQDNAGQASALNLGLKHVTGEYLIYPDSDDILYPNHIEEKVKYMNSHPDIGMAFCILDVVKENDLNEIISQEYRRQTENDNLALDLINFKNILWPPIGNIIRTKNLFSVLPDREIFTGRGGQNFQIQFPMAVNFKYGYINQSLGKYVVRGESYSHTASQDSLRFKKFMNIWINTIQKLNNEQLKEFYIQKTLDCFEWHIDQKNKKSSSAPFNEVKSKLNLKFYLFNCLPILSIKEKHNRLRIKMFGMTIFKIIKR